MPGSTRHDAVAHQHRVDALAHDGQLVDVEPDAVSEPVLERAEAAVVDDLCGQVVDAASLDARMDRGERLRLRVLRDRVGALELVLDRAGRERARAVGAVAVHLRARVDDDELVRLDAPVGRMVVRDRAVRAAPDDRVEGRRVGAGLADRPLDEPDELLLRLADEPVVGERLEGAADDRCGVPDRVQLGRLLGRTDACDDARGRMQLDGVASEVGQRGDGDVVGLEGELEPAELAKTRAEPAVHVALRLQHLDVRGARARPSR